MTVARGELQVTWDTGSNSKSVAAASNATSDAMALDATAFAAQIHCYADNAGTPASGDTVDFYVLQSGGDPIGTGSDVFDNSNVAHATFLVTVNTFAADASQSTVPFPMPQKAFRIYAVNNDGGSAATVGATITYLTG